MFEQMQLKFLLIMTVMPEKIVCSFVYITTYTLISDI